MARQFNFSAGPATLPAPVLEEIQESILEFGTAGAGIMEVSHRSAAFSEVHQQAQQRLRSLLEIPQDYTVLLLQGGASLQFYMTALNLLNPDHQADYLVTGAWSEKALKEAARISDSKAIWNGKEENFRQLPTSDHYTPRPGARYLHYTSNNTIYGTQFASPPQAKGVPLIADMSSDICSRPVNLDQHAVLYAGAQKNLGPSGLTVVILSPSAIEQSRANASSRDGGIPSMLNYALMADKDSLFNTPNTLAIYALERMLSWLQDLGGLSAVEDLNQTKAQLLYQEIDRSEFWTPHAHRDNRSLMNITWRAPTEALEADFLAEAHQQGLHSLKGHRSIGGIRASTYNACPLAGVEALVEFMGHFEATHG